MFRNIGETLLAMGTLGAGAVDEQDNREEVLVLDSSSGDLCFEWKRSFPEGTLRSRRMPQFHHQVSS